MLLVTFMVILIICITDKKFFYVNTTKLRIINLKNQTKYPSYFFETLFHFFFCFGYSFFFSSRNFIDINSPDLRSITVELKQAVKLSTATKLFKVYCHSL